MRECWIDSREIVSTSSDWRLHACCLQHSASASKQGNNNIMHTADKVPSYRIIIHDLSLCLRDLYFIAYINIRDGWHMQNKCWFFIKCIYELLIIASPSLGRQLRSSSPPRKHGSCAPVLAIFIEAARPPGHQNPLPPHHEGLPAARRPRPCLYPRPRRCGRWSIVSDETFSTNQILILKLLSRHPEVPRRPAVSLRCRGGEGGRCPAGGVQEGGQVPPPHQGQSQ